MNVSGLFEPTLGAYALYLLNFCVRYFVVAGILGWVLREKWLAYRIQESFPSLREVGYEIRWSMLNAALTGLSTILLYWLIREGGTKMYFAVAERGWLYFCASAALVFVGYDMWFYWYHRLLHTPWLFRHVHAVHHRAVNPTAFAAYALHPIETVVGNSYFVLLVLLVPIHPLAFGGAGLCISMFAFLVHSGYEFFPRGFTQCRLFWWLSTSTHHNMHHRHDKGNYGSLFNYWDYLMGTNHPAYHDTFEAIKARSDALAHDLAR